MLADLVSPRASLMCLRKRCEQGTCPEADLGSGQKQLGAWWGAGVQGGKAGAIRGWFPGSALTCHHRSVQQPKDSH